MAILSSAAEARKDLGKMLWDLLAYVARYGHQPLDVTLEMPICDLRRLSDALSEIVRRENSPRGHDG